MICTAKYPRGYDDSDDAVAAALSDGGRAVILEDVRDPGNVGGILRSAAAFGVGTVLLVSCADPLGDRAVRASMGAVFRLRIAVSDSVSAVGEAIVRSGRKAVAAALTDDAGELGAVSLGKDDVPVIGNEGHGLSREMLSHCSSSLKIPMTPGCESLNARAAAAVILWEYFKSVR